MRARKVLPARVYRFYRGGALIDALRGEPPVDDVFPEDWLASVTPASNPGRDDPTEGLSRLADGTLLRDAIETDPEAWLGRTHVDAFGPTTGVLVKLLDPAQRLPVHAHPDRRFAARQLGSRFGKTEAWIVLATREEAATVWVGWRERLDAPELRRLVDEQDAGAMLELLNEVEVRAGDVVYVPGGVPHAIGPGALIAELQEPTDFSLLLEWRGFPVAEPDAHLGLGWDAALGAVSLEAHEPIRELPEAAREFFWADRERVVGGRFTLLLVTEGEGELDGLASRPGDAIAVPAAHPGLTVPASLGVLRCLPPEPA